MQLKDITAERLVMVGKESFDLFQLIIDKLVSFTKQKC